MKMYLTLQKDKLKDIAPGTFVYLSTGALGTMPEAHQVPCVFGGLVDGVVRLHVFKTSGKKQYAQEITVEADVKTYGPGGAWLLQVEDGITVETPDGILWARDGGCDEYPGIRTDLVKDGKVIAGLALTEYISGGEGLCGGRVDEAYEQLAEVPTVRIMRKDGTTLKDDTERPRNIKDADDYRVRPGLITRAWADDNHDEDHHKRVFHFGYEE